MSWELITELTGTTSQPLTRTVDPSPGSSRGAVLGPLSPRAACVAGSQHHYICTWGGAGLPAGGEGGLWVLRTPYSHLTHSHMFSEGPGLNLATTSLGFGLGKERVDLLSEYLCTREGVWNVLERHGRSYRDPRLWGRPSTLIHSTPDIAQDAFVVLNPSGPKGTRGHRPSRSA